MFFFPYENGSILKRKESAPLGSKFFPFRDDPFQKRLGAQECRQEVTKVLSLLETRKINKIYRAILNVVELRHAKRYIYMAFVTYTFDAPALLTD